MVDFDPHFDPRLGKNLLLTEEEMKQSWLKDAGKAQVEILLTDTLEKNNSKKDQLQKPLKDRVDSAKKHGFTKDQIEAEAYTCMQNEVDGLKTLAKKDPVLGIQTASKIGARITLINRLLQDKERQPTI